MVQQKTATQQDARPVGASYPQLIDITSSTRIQFDHLSSPEQKFIVESMGGRTFISPIHQTSRWRFTARRQRVLSFTTIMTEPSQMHPTTLAWDIHSWAMGASVGDYNNDGWPDRLVTCFGGVVLYRNNGDGTFSDITKSAGLDADSLWATGAAFGDYDGDGWAYLFVAHYVDFHLDNVAADVGCTFSKSQVPS